MHEPGKETTLVDGVAIAKTTSIDDAPAIRLTDDRDAAYHKENGPIEVRVRNRGPNQEHIVMELDRVVLAVPRAQLEAAILTVNPDGEDERRSNCDRRHRAQAAATLRKTRNLLAAYRRILNSEAILNVFQMSQIHDAPYSGEQIKTDDVDTAIADADRVLGGGE